METSHSRQPTPTAHWVGIGPPRRAPTFVKKRPHVMHDTIGSFSSEVPFSHRCQALSFNTFAVSKNLFVTAVARISSLPVHTSGCFQVFPCIRLRILCMSAIVPGSLSKTYFSKPPLMLRSCNHFPRTFYFDSRTHYMNGFVNLSCIQQKNGFTTPSPYPSHHYEY